MPDETKIVIPKKVPSKKEVEVMQHGAQWINEGNEITCPECMSRSPRIRCTVDKGFDLSTAKDPNIGRATHKYIAKCQCTLCSCAFEIRRSE